MAATAVLEASELTLGQQLEVLTPHQVQSVLETKDHQWLTGGSLLKYQALLLNIPNSSLRSVKC